MVRSDRKVNSDSALWARNFQQPHEVWVQLHSKPIKHQRQYCIKTWKYISHLSFHLFDSFSAILCKPSIVPMLGTDTAVSQGRPRAIPSELPSLPSRIVVISYMFIPTCIILHHFYSLFVFAKSVTWLDVRQLIVFLKYHQHNPLNSRLGTWWGADARERRIREGIRDPKPGRRGAQVLLCCGPHAPLWAHRSGLNRAKIGVLGSTVIQCCTSFKFIILHTL